MLARDWAVLLMINKQLASQTRGILAHFVELQRSEVVGGVLLMSWADLVGYEFLLSSHWWQQLVAGADLWWRAQRVGLVPYADQPEGSAGVHAWALEHRD